MRAQVVITDIYKLELNQTQNIFILLFGPIYNSGISHLLKCIDLWTEKTQRRD